MDFTQEPIGNEIYVCTSKEHRFGTDAFLLTNFSHYKQKDKVCEFGTGCGIIPLLMQKQKPPALIYAIDIQEQAIEQLKAGIVLSHAENIIPVCCDLKHFRPAGTEFDLVLCNPPYQPCGSGIESEMEAQRIARQEIFCTPEEICTQAKKLLKSGGRLCVCGKPEWLPEYICAMRNAGTEPKRLQFVSKTAEDKPWLFLLEGRKDGKKFLQMEKPFIMYKNHQLTEQAEALYQKGKHA